MNRAFDSSETWYDSIAQDYQEARHGYPEQLIEDMIRLTRIQMGGRILEIGCGTGQASMPLARRGYQLLCIDRSHAMISIARSNFSAYQNIEFCCARFEDYAIVEQSFDVVLSATAFHWIDEACAYEKAALSLRDGGHIALIWTLWPSLEANPFEEAVSELFRTIAPDLLYRISRPCQQPRGDIKEREIYRSGLFGNVVNRRYTWCADYDSVAYTRLLKTYYNDTRLENLLTAIRNLIDVDFGGVVAQQYESVLYIARKI